MRVRHNPQDDVGRHTWRDEGEEPWEPRWLIFVAGPDACLDASTRDKEEVKVNTPAAQSYRVPLGNCSSAERCRCMLFAVGCDLGRLSMATFRAGRPTACCAAADRDGQRVPYRSREHAGWTLPLAGCNDPAHCTCDVTYEADQDAREEETPCRSGGCDLP